VAGEQIPAWLAARAGGGGGGRGTTGARGARIAGALALLLAGGVAGYVARDARQPPPAPPPVAAAPPPVCPAPTPCAPSSPRPPAAAARRSKPRPPAAAKLEPLPAAGPDDVNARKAALLRFANERVGDLRHCLPGDGAGAGVRPVGANAYTVGAAIETDIAGGIDEVKIIGAEPPDPHLRRCYAERIKTWTLPRDLARSRDNFLVTFRF